VLRGDGERVEEHQDDDQPIEMHRFHRHAAVPSAVPVPATPAPTAGVMMSSGRGRGSARRGPTQDQDQRIYTTNTPAVLSMNFSRCRNVIQRSGTSCGVV